MKACNECGDKHYAKGKCKLHYRMPSQINPKPIKSNKPLQSTKTIKPIPKQSDKEKKRQAAYSVLKKEYMKYHPVCEAQLDGCTSFAIDIHHLFSGADRYKYFLDTGTWCSVCRFCHMQIHDQLSAEELIELGLRLKE